MQAKKKQKYLLKVWGSLCAGYFSPWRKIPLQFCSHISQEACGAIILSQCQSCSALGQHPAPRQPSWVAETGRVGTGYGCALQPKETWLAGTPAAANCSATALHLSPIPTMCSDTPACAPYAEDMNAWPCTMLFLSLQKKLLQKPSES